MSKYVYSLVKELNNSSSKLVNYLCKDNYIHVRLRDFGNKKEVISGLEDKLTFYLVWEFDRLLPQYLEESLFDITKKEKYDEIFESCVKKFVCSDEYSEMKLVLHCIYPNCLGVNILTRYSRKDTYDTILAKFGSVYMSSSDEEFEDFIGMSLYQFLRDENIFLVVDTKKKVNCIKYIKKYANKSKGLWEE